MGGAQEYTGVAPDLATYAKALAGGAPIAMLVGRTDIMETVASGDVLHGGSFNSNVLSVAAAHAALSHIMEDSELFYKNMTEKGFALMDGLRDASKRAGSDLLVQGIGSMFATAFTHRESISDYREQVRYCDLEKQKHFAQEMLERGIRICADGRWHLSSAHTDEDVEKTAQAAYDALKAIG